MVMQIAIYLSIDIVYSDPFYNGGSTTYAGASVTDHQWAHESVIAGPVVYSGRTIVMCREAYATSNGSCAIPQGHTYIIEAGETETEGDYGVISSTINH